MREKLERLRSILNSIIKWIPNDIKPEYEKLLPSEARFLNFGEKMNLYSFAQKAHDYIPKDNWHSIGELIRIVDEITT
ncbi:MAG TPA: hypothetical protein P5548_01105 [Candidatus Moranbacteria bacterium]|nr:hypothetical protein [Candidatus Moranbacteria bacterium]HRZ33489.1 hypothetical protein [Candidatus Moranbacteria bacterium]